MTIFVAPKTRIMKKILAIFSLLLLVSCLDESLPADALLPEANGQHGEILVLMEDQLWNGALGQAVTEQLTIQAEGRYLRPEPMFSLYQKPPADLNHLSQLSRNILKFMIDYDSTYTETAVVEKTNHYAKNQIFIIIKDSDPDRLLAFAQHKMQPIIDRFNSFEVNCLMSMYRTDPSLGIKSLVEEKFGISIHVPSDFLVKSEKKDFILIKRDRSKNVMPNEANNADGGTFWIQQGLLFWSSPYDPDSSQLTVENVLKNRDSTLKYNVPGNTSGTYMGTEYSQYYEPIGRQFKFNGHQAVEIRGLWLYNGATFSSGGGPFIQYSIHNESKQTIVTVCGYIYGPQYDKREYLREIEAMLRTIEINP